MALTSSPSGVYQTPDQDESAQLDYWLAQLAVQIEKQTLQNTKGIRSRVHTVKGLTGTTDANGYVTVNHGAPFTPSFVQASINGNAVTLGYVISSGDITATTVRVRLGNWSTGGALNVQPVNAALALVCVE